MTEEEVKSKIIGAALDVNCLPYYDPHLLKDGESIFTILFKLDIEKLLKKLLRSSRRTGMLDAIESVGQEFPRLLESDPNTFFTFVSLYDVIQKRLNSKWRGYEFTEEEIQELKIQYKGEFEDLPLVE
jgi:hypothetical protein